MTEMRAIQTVFGKHPFDVLSKAKERIMSFIEGNRVISNDEYLILRQIGIFAKRDPFEMMHTMNTKNIAPIVADTDENEIRIAKEAYHFVALMSTWLGQIHDEKEVFEVFLRGYKYELDEENGSHYAMDILRGIREVAYVD